MGTATSPTGWSAGIWPGTARSAERGNGLALAVLIIVMFVGSVAMLDVPIASGVAVLAMFPAAIVDAHERRIPDGWVVLSAMLLAMALALSAALGTVASIWSVVAGGAVMATPILIMHLISPAAMGFGDVKAAAVLGMALGVVDWQLGLVGLALAAGIGATVGTMRRSATIAFGPLLLIGTVVALVASPILLGPLTEAGRW